MARDLCSIVVFPVVLCWETGRLVSAQQGGSTSSGEVLQGSAQWQSLWFLLSQCQCWKAIPLGTTQLCLVGTEGGLPFLEDPWALKMQNV